MEDVPTPPLPLYVEVAETSHQKGAEVVEVRPNITSGFILLCDKGNRTRPPVYGVEVPHPGSPPPSPVIVTGAEPIAVKVVNEAPVPADTVVVATDPRVVLPAVLVK